MQPKIKFLFIEFLWLILAFVLALTTTALIFGLNSIYSKAKIEGFDATYIFRSNIVIIPLFLLSTFCLFYLKELTHKFARQLPNVITVISGLASILILTMGTSFLVNLGSFPSGGWTVYPPLSALSDSKIKIDLKDFPFFRAISNWIILFQLVIISCLLFMTYRLGTKKCNS